MTSHIQNEILKQKNLTGSGLEGPPKLLKAFFLEINIMSKLRDTRDSNSGNFSPTVLKFCNFIVK